MSFPDSELKRLKEDGAETLAPRCHLYEVHGDKLTALLNRLEAAENVCRAMSDAWKMTVVIGPENVGRIDVAPIREALEAWRKACGE